MEARRIHTQQFGELEVEPRHIFFFENGLMGFENLREFVLVSDDESAPFKWLISIEESGIGFPLLSPWHIDAAYDIGNEFDPDRNAVFVVVTLSPSGLTANMKAPVLLDTKSQSGRQVILPNEQYQPMFSFGAVRSTGERT
ncbi:MAG TPA: flagellar assembly protein FliW [Patescibacteria group bacterium]|nr:flagellar assembly protein FliW [Patescibacteria group bacterium]